MPALTMKWTYAFATVADAERAEAALTAAGFAPHRRSNDPSTTVRVDADLTARTKLVKSLNKLRPRALRCTVIGPRGESITVSGRRGSR